jgi:hypothetical protein
MNKEQIIDEVYENYFLKTENVTLETLHVPYRNTHLYGTVSGPISNTKFRPYTQDEFINKCKTDTEFSEKWGLKIEERELSLEERQNLYFKLNPEFRLVHENMNKQMDNFNTPTKQITITYKDTIIESYE